MRPLLPDKLFFRIGEVAEIVGVRAHVLRYWEAEFGILKPMKTRGAHRQYRRRDVELALVIKRLLQEEGFTTAGAKKRLRELGHVETKADAPKPEDPSVLLRAELLTLRAELGALLARVDGLGTKRAPVVVLEDRAATVAAPLVVLPTDGAGGQRRFSE